MTMMVRATLEGAAPLRKTRDMDTGELTGDYEIGRVYPNDEFEWVPGDDERWPIPDWCKPVSDDAKLQVYRQKLAQHEAHPERFPRPAEPAGVKVRRKPGRPRKAETSSAGTPEGGSSEQGSQD